MGRARLLPWVSIVLGPILLLGPMLARGEALFWGTPLLQFVPWRAFALDSLRQGYLPLWNPYLGMGAPLVANYQSAVFYLPNALLALTGPAAGNGWLVLVHWIWAGAGMILLARRLGASPLGQSISAVAWSLSSALVARAGFLSINATAAWIPWVIAASDRLGVESVGRLRPRSLVMLASALSAQWLAGHAQTAWYMLLLVVAWVGWRGARQGGRHGLLRAWARFGLVAALALALAAVQLLPTAEYLALSARQNGLDEAFALNYSLWPWRILGLLLPGLFGSPARGDYWGYGNYWEDALYIGVLPLLLALTVGLCALRGRSSRTPEVRFLLGVTVVSMLLALGKNTPVFPFLFRHIPTFDLFQAPTRWNLLMVFSLALLAGLGAEEWKVLQGRGLYWARLGTAGSVALGLSAWFLGPRLLVIEPSFVRAFGLAGLWLVLAGALALTRSPESRLVWMAAVSLYVVADLTWANWGLNPTAPAALYEGRSALTSAISGNHRVHLPGDLTEQLTLGRFFRFDTFDAAVDWRQARDFGLPNTPLLDSIPSADNFDPLLSARYVTWMDCLEATPQVQRQLLLALMDVGWVGELEDGRVIYAPVEGAARVRLFVSAVPAGDAASALDLLLSPQTNPTQMLVLEGEAETVLSHAGGGGLAELVESADPNRVLVQVTAPQGAWLLLADTWYPGWRALVDGQPTALYRADYLFRAVWVPPGEHSVLFEYVPWTFRLGTLISALAWAVLLVSVRRWASD
ncbi:MAG: YfhO family protein [Chloroflexota bacterium]